MHTVKQLYETFKDDSGHTYLVKKEYGRGFFKQLDNIEEAYSEHNDEDVYYEQFDDLLSYFNVERLEDDRYYVVKLNDILED